MMIQAAEYKSSAEMLASYKATRARLMGSGVKTRPANENAQVVKLEPRKPFITKRLPLWEQGDIQFDAHVLAFQAWRVDQGIRCKAWLRNRCIELDVSYDDMMGPKRDRKTVAIRDMLMYEVKTFVKPEISWPELGRLFGGREHSTCFFSVMKVLAASGDPDAIESINKRKTRLRRNHDKAVARKRAANK